MTEPLKILLELSGKESTGEAFALRQGLQAYTLRGEGGDYEAFEVEWDSLLGPLAALQRPPVDAALIQAVGERMRLLLPGAVAARLATVLPQAEREGRRLVFTVRSAAAELYALPWELMVDRASGRRLVDHPDVLVRYEYPTTSTTRPVMDPMPAGGRILYAWSAAGGPVPVREHLRAIQSAARERGYDFVPARDVLANVTYPALREALAAARAGGALVTMVHLLCHGGAKGVGHGLVWDSDDGSTTVDALQLTKLFSPYSGMVQTVLLAACNSGNAGQVNNPLGSVALALHRSGIRAVIASRYPLGVSGSNRLAAVLYEQLLVESASLETALLAARAALWTEDDDRDGAALQLFSREADGDDIRPLVSRPFRGLRAFQTRHARLFFGRDPERDAICGALTRLGEAEKPRFVVVAGASGTGKSSVVLAGVIPALAKRDPGLRAAVIRPGSAPLQALAAVDAETTLLVVDQFEEIFTRTESSEVREAFARRLWERAQGGVAVVVTVRIDYLGMCGELHLDDAGLRMDRVAFDEAHRVFVAQMGREALLSAIVSPARMAGLELGAGLPERIVEDVEGEAGALPLVQYALDELWERRSGRLLTWEAYREIGGAVGALHTRAGTIVDAMDDATRYETRRLLVRLTGVGFAGNDTRRRLPEEALTPSEPGREEQRDAAIAALVDARLLVRSEEGGVATIEVAHEALIRKWPLLRDWMEEDRARLAGLRELDAWVSQWRSFKALLDGDRLAFARKVSQEFPYDVSEDARELLRESEEARRRMREEAEAFDRQRVEGLERDRRIAAGFAVVMILCAVALGIFGLRARADRIRAVAARDEANVAEGVAKSAEADARDATRTALGLQQVAEDPSNAVLLLREVKEPGEQPTWLQAALDARGYPITTARVKAFGLPQQVVISDDGVWVLTTTPDGAAALRRSDGQASGWQSVEDAEDDAVVPPTGALSCAAIGPDATFLVTGGADGAVRMWHPGGPGEPATTLELRPPDGQPVVGVAITPDGARVLAALGAEVDVWSAADATFERALRMPRGNVAALAASPDGDTVAVISDRKELKFWSLSTPAALRGGQDGVGATALGFSRDGGRLWTAGARGVEVWDARAGARRAVFTTRIAQRAADLSPDGRLAVAAGVDGVARLWELGERSAPEELRVGPDPLRAVRFSPSSARVVAVAEHGAAYSWLTETPEVAPYPLGGAFHQPVAVAFDPGGEHVVTVSDHGTVRTWDVASRVEPSVFGVRYPVRQAIEAGDGSTLLVMTDGAVRRARNGEATELVVPASAGVRLAALGTSADVLLTAVADGGARLWDLHTGALRWVRAGSGKPAASIGYSPDASRVLLADTRGSLRTWRADGQGRVAVTEPDVSGLLRVATFLPDGSRVLTVEADGHAFVTSVTGETGADGVAGGRVALPGSGYHAAAFAPAGDLLVLVDDRGGVSGWRVTAEGVSPTPAWEERGNGNPTYAVAFTPDGGAVVTAGSDHVVRRWPLQQGKPVRARVAVTGGHDAAIRHLAVGTRPGADGGPPVELIATGSDDNTARVYALIERKLVETLILRGHAGPITSVSFSKDAAEASSRVVTVSADGTARRWPVDPDAMLQALWRASPYCFSLDERKRYLGEDNTAARAHLAECKARVEAGGAVATTDLAETHGAADGGLQERR